MCGLCNSKPSLDSAAHIVILAPLWPGTVECIEDECMFNLPAFHLHYSLKYTKATVLYIMQSCVCTLFDYRTDILSGSKFTPEFFHTFTFSLKGYSAQQLHPYFLFLWDSGNCHYADCIHIPKSDVVCQHAIPNFLQFYSIVANYHVNNGNFLRNILPLPPVGDYLWILR